MVALCRQLESGKAISDIKDIPQTVFLAKEKDIPGGIGKDDIVLHSHSECLASKKGKQIYISMITNFMP